MKLSRGPLPRLSQRRASFALPDLKHVEIAVIHEAKEWVVVSKPSGLLSVPGKTGTEDNMTARVSKLYPRAEHVKAVHRLDLSTSGLLMFALTRRALSELSKLFATRKVHKKYIALLSGPKMSAQGQFQKGWQFQKVDSSKGSISLPLRLDPFQRPLQLVDPVHGKESITEWSLRSNTNKGRLVELTPITGRTHQLRIHCAHPLGLGRPIIGDELYGHQLNQSRAATQLCLHAEQLYFTDPMDRQKVQLTLPAPDWGINST